MNPLVRVRLVLARRPSLYWLAVAAVAAVAGVVVSEAVAAVDDARREWGRDRPVLIAARDAVPGEPLTAMATGATRPGPMVPPAALAEPPAGAVLRQHVAAGEILVGPDVVAPGGPVALIPAGWLAVPLAEAVPTGAAVGDHVLVASGGVVLAAEGLVVGVLSDGLLVAVPGDDAPMVAAAGSDATVLLAP